MHDIDTISVYDEQANTYKEMIDELSEDQTQLKFASLFEKGSRILDLGCGPAVSSASFRALGLSVDPVDASREMVELANSTYEIGARQLTFNEIDNTQVYHGVWANFSLLHATRDDFPKILQSLHVALKPNGYLHTGMKTGSGSKRDKLGRFYTYYGEDELSDLLRSAGFTILTIKTGADPGLAGNVEPWITITSQRS